MKTGSYYNYIFFTILITTQIITAMEQPSRELNVQSVVLEVSTLIESGICRGFAGEDWRTIISHTEQLKRAVEADLVKDKTVQNNIWQGIVNLYRGYNINLKNSPNNKDEIMSCFISSLDLFKQACADNAKKPVRTLSQEDKFKRMYLKTW